MSTALPARSALVARALLRPLPGFSSSSPATTCRRCSSSRTIHSSSASSVQRPVARAPAPLAVSGTSGSRIKIVSPARSFYPQNQVAPDSNKDAQGRKRVTAKASFKGARFVAAAGSPESLPKKGWLQEIIVAGRANSGKSSLLNGLMQSQTLVKTSGKAGHTNTLNFFEIPGKMLLVDSPGYGDRGRPEWGDIFDHFMTRRKPGPPSLILILYPLAHGLLPSDQLFLEALPPSVPLLPIFTKTDLCPITEIAEKKRKLNLQIQALRLEARGSSSGGPGTEDVVVGETWDGLCVSVKKGWVFRDQTVDAVRDTILSQLQRSALKDSRTMEAHLREVKRTPTPEATAYSSEGTGVQAESAKLQAELDAFFGQDGKM